MLFNVNSDLSVAKNSTLVLFLDSDKQVLKSQLLSTPQLQEVEELCTLANFKGSSGQTSNFYNLKNFDCARLVLVGVGKVEDGKVDVSVLKSSMSSVVSSLTKVQAKSLVLLTPETLLDEEDEQKSAFRTARVMVESLNYARYQFKRFITLDKSEDGHAEDCSCCTGIKSYHFVVDSNYFQSFEQGVEFARCVSAGVKLARDLGNLPPNECTPEYLARTGEKLAMDFENVEVEVLGEQEMKKLGMGCYLAVGKGSVNKPAMTILRYYGAKDRNERPYVFVGKGMTFDAGGYSLKPAAGMQEMKYDMCGAASVLGLMKSVAELELPLNLVVVVAGCENLIDGNAYRPGDILKSMSGLTVEIDNTDAEGRLVLCDALTYVSRFNPQTVVDVATLTGACMVALGSKLTGVFSNTEGLAQEVVKCGDYVDDRGWHLPLNEDFRNEMRGNHADLQNSSGSRLAGASTAAAFLSYFTKDYRWVHLDIAGTGWVSGKTHLATGRPISMMVTFLQRELEAKQA